MRRIYRKTVMVLTTGALFVSCLIARANVDIQEFSNEAMRAQYQHLVRELRCPKCQNQNLSDSNSTIAIDLRREVARLVNEGNTDEQIKQYMGNRYGDFVLYMPPVQDNTLMLWWSPVIMLVLGGMIFIVIVLGRRKQAGSIVEESSDDIADSKE